MEAKELRQEYRKLYDYMAESKNPVYMKHFGKVMTEMYDWFASNRPENAEEWLEKLEIIKWKNYLTPKEAEKIIAEMEPRAPWTREQWKMAMAEHGYELEEMPCYNQCTMYVTMSMIYSDSAATLKKYVGEGDLFTAIHDLAVDRLKDKDGWFDIRAYFSL